MKGSWMSRRDHIAVEVLKVLLSLDHLREVDSLADRVVAITDTLLSKLDVSPGDGGGVGLEVGDWASEFDEQQRGVKDGVFGVPEFDVEGQSGVS
jgi:hypothetical protein